MVLGGIDKDGNSCFNILSEMCLKSSGKLLMIDPKINLRVDKNTPIEVYRLGSELTKAGLGFPQYSNDDIVIPALEKLGYSHEDAVNYVVAACWEFIIPKYGYEIVNLGALNFPKVVIDTVNDSLENAASFDEFMKKVDVAIKKEAEKLTDLKEVAPFLPSPLYDLLISERRYRNFGFHGTGVASAADSLYAIKEHVFDKKDVTKERLIDAIKTNFVSDKELLRVLRYETEKMGNDIDEIDNIATRILDDYADGFEGKVNAYGGKYRAGTGTAMFYLWHANDIGATPDGRRKGEPFGTNFSPNLFAKIDGPVSDIRSFTKQHFTRCCNGGPLTLEFASSAFNSSDSVNKLADLVRYFILRGGHQLQLNAVNAEKMKDAQIHPEKYSQLVVRI
ncbi:MAG: pyruvate formate-lyase, partial [Clostridia bacterium]|nr:pyruvate formate-lyase [Clostridia bacterium]